MTDKFNSNKRKGGSKPYDSKIHELCLKCSGDVLYRKSSYFSNKVYYKVCSNCGWYQVMPKEEWADKIYGVGETESKDEVVKQ